MEDTIKLQQQIDDLTRRLETVEANSIANPFASSTNQNVLQNFSSDRVLETVWNDFLYVIPSMVDIDRYLIALHSTGTAAYDDTGLVLQTGTTINSFADVSLGVDSSVVLRTRETRFRVIAKVSHTTNIDASLVTLGIAPSIGFEFLNGTLYGFSSNVGGDETTVVLQTYVANTYYILELYYNLGGIKFFVNNVEKGSISGNSLGTSTSGIKFFDADIATTDTVNKILSISLAEFAQRRK